jgi:hypothetical protein
VKDRIFTKDELNMTHAIAKAIAATLGLITLFAHAAESKTLGPWYDSENLRCEITFVQANGKWEEVWDKCQKKDLNGTRQPLRPMGANKFKQVEFKVSWHYLTAASGDLEVRDNEGIVRIIRSTGPKTPAQQAAALKSEGASIGMSPDQVLASSWGKPRKINTTTTAQGERQQWVYSGGYLYFTNGVLTAIQN